MTTRSELQVPHAPRFATAVARAALLLLWHALRIPIFVVLRLAEPLVYLILGGLGLLSIIGAVFYQFLTPLAHPPFWLLMGFAAACGVTLLLYGTLLRFFSR